MNYIKKNQGVSLIVLVITIIVLIVLAGVAIANLSGNNSIINKAQQAKSTHDAAQEAEKTEVGNYEEFIASKNGGGSSGENPWIKRKFTSSNVIFDKRYEGYFTSAEEKDWIIINSDGSLLSSWAGLETKEMIDNYDN